jgi:hypothetical protein
MTKSHGLAFRCGGYDVADFNFAIGDNDAVNQKFNQLPFLLEVRYFEAGANSLGESVDRCNQSRQLSALIHL